MEGTQHPALSTQHPTQSSVLSPQSCTQHSALSTQRLALGALALITLVGLGLRLAAIGHGLPYQYVPDESTMVGSALRMGANRSLEPPTFIYPALLMYVFAGEYAGLLVVGRLVGMFDSVAHFQQFAFTDPTLFYLLPRITIAIAGAATIPLTYLVGRRLYGSGAGLVSAGLLAASVMHVQMSHQARHWVPVTLLAMAILWVSLDLLERGRRRDYWLSGLLVGLAAATSFNGFLLMVLPLAAHLLRWRGRGPQPLIGEKGGGLGCPQTPRVETRDLASLRRTPLTPPGGRTPCAPTPGTPHPRPLSQREREYTASPPSRVGKGAGGLGRFAPWTRPSTQHIIQMLLLAPGVFFALNPYVLLRADRFVGFHTSGERSIGGQILGHYDSYLQQFLAKQGFTFFAEATLAYEPAITILGIVGAVLAIRMYRPTAALVLIYPAFHYLTFATTAPSLEQRYMLPAVALLVLPAGLAGARALGWLHRRVGEGPGMGMNRRATVAMGIVAVLFAGLVSLPSLRYDWLLSQPDTRTLAKEWIERSIPAGEDVAVESYSPPLTPDLDTLRAQQRSNPASLGARDQWLLEKGLPPGEAAFRLTRLSLVDTSPSVDNMSPYLETQRHRYFVVSDFRWKADHRGHQALKDYLARDGRLVQRFSPSRDAGYVPSDLLNNMEDPPIELWRVERPGPRIEIYEVPR